MAAIDATVYQCGSCLNLFNKREDVFQRECCILSAPNQESEDSTKRNETQINANWNDQQTKMLISLYSQNHNLIGKGTNKKFKTKKEMWDYITDNINAKFSANFLTMQTENRWKTVDRAYKRTKIYNNKSGNDRRNFAYEEDFQELQSSVVYSPEVTIAPGEIFSSSLGSDSNQEVPLTESSSSLTSSSASPSLSLAQKKEIVFLQY